VAVVLLLLFAVGSIFAVVGMRQAHSRQRTALHHAQTQYQRAIARTRAMVPHPVAEPQVVVKAPRERDSRRERVAETLDRIAARISPGHEIRKTTLRVQLDSDKARLLADLLSPAHVEVLVKRHYEAVTVEGSAQAVQAVERFAELIARYRGLRPGEIELRLRSDAPSWTVRTPVDLHDDQAAVLSELLAMPDVPVGMVRSRSGVDVLADPEDARTVEDFLRLLHGR
jgi:hypothetical protein